MRRRHFLTVSATTLGGVLVYTLDRKPGRVHAQGGAQTGAIKIPLRFFAEEEALAIAAAAARIFPSDESGPGANEAGVVIYIDRQLASAYGRDHYRYTQAPFADGIPEQGYQGKETPREIYRAGLKELGRFHLLGAIACRAGCSAAPCQEGDVATDSSPFLSHTLCTGEPQLIADCQMDPELPCGVLLNTTVCRATKDAS